MDFDEINNTYTNQDNEYESEQYSNNGMLINCPDCGNMVSKRAAVCPKCGCPISDNSINVIAPEKNCNKSKKEIKKEKKKIPVKLLILASLALLLIIFLCVYFGNYFAAKSLAKKEKFVPAYNHLIIRAVTSIHDKKFVKYVNAGCYKENGYPKEAAEEFYKLSNYMNSFSLAEECSLEYAKKLVDEEKHQEEYNWAEEISQYGSEVSKDIQLEARCLLNSDKILAYDGKGFDSKIIDISNEFKKIYNEGYEEAYEFYVASLYDVALYYSGIDDWEKCLDTIEPVKNFNANSKEMYASMVKISYNRAKVYFSDGEYDKAYKIFSKLGDYEDSASYKQVSYDLKVVVAAADAYSNELMDAFSYTYAIPQLTDVMSKDYRVLDKYLRGNWTTLWGNYYFNMKKDGYISYNVPWKTGDEPTYHYENNAIYFGSVKVFTFEISNYNEMFIYAAKDGNVYHLVRN